MIWIVFGAMAVAVFLSVGRILANADPRGSRAPIRGLSLVCWIVGLLLTIAGKPLIGLCVMAVGAFGLGAVTGSGPTRPARRPAGARGPTYGRSDFGEGNRGGASSGGGPDFEGYANFRRAQSEVRARPGVMTEEQAYQILGLKPGATAQEIARAHRTLMKKVHPDQGGTTELAARVNAAKDILAARGHV